MTSNQASFHSMKEQDVRQSYEGFQSQRHDTQNLNENEDELRGFVREYHIKYPIQSLLSHFKAIFNEKGYKTTQIFPGKVMLVKLRLIDRLKFVICKRLPCKYVLSVKTQEYKSVRKVFINKLETKDFTVDEVYDEINELFIWIDKNNSKIPELRLSNQGIDFEPGSEYEQDIFSLEATSTYMYHKIFVDRNYSMGRKMDKLVNESKDMQLFENSQREAEVIIGGLKQITEDMLKSFNCTRKQLLEILCHCRKTVEDYYHDRKFVLCSKENIEMDRGSIETEINEKVPMTIKSLFRLIYEVNSQKILREIFLTSYVFQFECEMNGLSQSDKEVLGKKLGNKFGKQIQNKIRSLGLWGYAQSQILDKFQDFLN